MTNNFETHEIKYIFIRTFILLSIQAVGQQEDYF